MKTRLPFPLKYWFALLIAVVFAGSVSESFAQNRVELSIRNRRIGNNGTIYYAEVWAHVPSTTNTWRVNGSNIIVHFNASALDRTAFSQTEPVVGANDSLSNAPGSYGESQGFSVMTQTEFSTDAVSLNIVKLFPPFFPKSGTFRIGTLRWNVTDASLPDNFTFNTTDNTVFHNVTSSPQVDLQLSPNCGTPNCYGTTNPVARTIGAPVFLEHPINASGGTAPVVQTATGNNQSAASASVCQGATATFSVLADGSGITYQWQVDTGSGFTNVTGNATATTSTLSIINAQASNSGTYRCVVSGTYAPPATSNSVTLTVNVPPSVASQPTSQFVCVGGTAVFAVSASGSSPLTYQWQQFNQFTSNYDNLTGANGTTLSFSNVQTAQSGQTYRVVISNMCGTVTSADATLNVNTVPVANTSFPISQTTCAGLTATFQASATGTPTPTIQWQVSTDGGGSYSNIAGATTSSYSFATVAGDNGNRYRALFTNVCGVSTSNVAVLTVNTAPAITSQPTSVTKCTLDNVTFTVAATGTGLTYQWRKNTSPISGATTSTYSISGIGVSDAGSYDVVISGVCAPSVTSQAAVLTVHTPAAITTQPVSDTKCVGSSVTFSVVASGTNPSYQWRKGGVAIAGQTGSSYTINPVAVADGASYDVVITSGGVCGNVVTSNSVTLTVHTPVAITTQPVSDTKCVGSSVTFSVVASGTNPSYQWRKNGVAISGQTGSNYTINPVAVADGASYDVVITSGGVCGNVVTSNSVTLTVHTPAAITAQPVSDTKCVGSSVIFSVVASGTNLSYQWRKGGVAIVGQTGSSYTINPVAVADGASYDVVITSGGVCGNVVTSNSVTLTVDTPATITAQPVSQTVCETTTVTFSVSATGTGLTYQWRKNGTNISGQVSATLVLTNVNPASAGTYDVVITSSGVCVPNTVTSNPATLTVNTIPTIATHPSNLVACTGDIASFSSSALGTPTPTMQWQVSTDAGASWNNIIGATTSPLSFAVTASDNGKQYRAVFSNTCGVATSNPATLNFYALPAITSQPNSSTLCVGATASFTVGATGANLTYQWRKNGVNITGNVSAQTATLQLANITTTDAGSFDVVVSNICNQPVTSNSVTLTVHTPAAITTQPVSDTKCVGSSVTFSVVASGTNLSYQWRKGGVAIAGQTGSSYTINPVAVADGASYDVVITSGGVCGNVVTSNSVTLTVHTPAAITAQPVSDTKCVGSSVIFSVVASGTNLSYQWRKGGVAIVGQTGSSYTINPVAVADGASYDVVITSGGVCGNVVTSNSVTLTVHTPATITAQPVSDTKCVGSSVTFSVTATGTGLSYQWRKGGVAIVGQTGSSLVIPSVVTGDAGTYDVVITSSGVCVPNTVTSSPVTLTVHTPATITAQPVSDTKCVGSSVTFSVTATGTGLTYQWRKNGVNIAGATASSYPISSVVVGDQATYDVVITSSGVCVPNTVTSSPVTLTVHTPATITAQPVSDTKCVGSSVTFSVTATGTGLSYQWRKNGVNIAGATASSYPIASVATGDAATYDVVITSSGVCVPNTVTSSPVTLTVHTPATITAQPVSEIRCEGTAVTFSVSATGTGLSYQWRKNGVAMSGKTASTLTISPVVVADQATYDVVITSSGVCVPNTVTSSPVSLTVYTAPVVTSNPQTIVVCAGDAATFTATATGIPTPAIQWQVSTNGGTSWSDLVGKTSSPLTFIAGPNDNGNQYRAVFSNTCNVAITSPATLNFYALPAITQQPSGVAVCQGQQVSMTVGAIGTGLTYQWRRGGNPIPASSNASAITATLVIPSAQAGDAAFYDVIVSNICNQPVTSNPVAIVVNMPPVVTSHPIAQVVCVGGYAQFTFQATGTGISYQWQKDGVNIPGAVTSTLTFPATQITDAGSYRVVVTGICSPSAISNAATLTINVPPTISSNPTSVVVCENGTTSFTVGAAGTGLTYQWYKDGIAISGAVSATYAIPSVAVANAGSYNVVVSGVCPPAVTSANATLTVNTLPRIATQPQGTTVCLNQSVTLTVGATGTGLAYQWYKDGVMIPGTNSANYIISNATATSGGSFTVVVSGTCTPSVTSSPAVVTVYTPVVITKQPVSRNICIGGNVTLSVLASGTGIGGGTTLQYQWRREGVNIPGANSEQLIISNAQFLMTGSYTCVVTGACGPVESNSVILFVNPQTSAKIKEPRNQRVILGSTAIFQVEHTVSTNDPVTIQWYKGTVKLANGGRISGVTTSTLVITNVQKSDEANDYYAVVTGPCGTAESNRASMNADQAEVAITKAPASITVCEGTASVCFEVTATTNVPGGVLKYEWFKGTTPIVGAFTNKFCLSNIKLSDAGDYNVKVTEVNSGISTNSGNATLTVRTAPVIQTQPVTLAVCSGTPAAFGVVVATASEPVTYQWFKNGTAISGATSASFVIANALASDLGTYWAVITNECGTTASRQVILTLKQAVQITAQPTPKSIRVTAPTQFTMSVTATGTGLTYQWFKDGTAITGAVSATFTKNPSVAVTDNGKYWCRVTGDCNTVNSDTVTVKIDGVGVNEPVAGMKFSLDQNHPNPFDGTTYINFTLAQSAPVKLVVTDMYGREIAVVADGTFDAGQYSLKFDASLLSSGTYFYTISVGGYSETKRMLLVK